MGVSITIAGACRKVIKNKKIKNEKLYYLRVYKLL